MAAPARLLVALLLALLLLVPLSTQANDPRPIRRSDELTSTVPVANFTVFRLDVDAAHTVSFSARVTQGPAIDVLLLSIKQFHVYEDRFEGNLSAIPTPIQQWLGTVYASGRAPNEGFYILVFDNTDLPLNGTRAVVPIEVQLLVRFVPRTTTDPGPLIPLLAAIAVAVVILGAWYLQRLYRQDVAAAPPPRAVSPPRQPPSAPPRREQPPARRPPPPQSPPRMRYSDGSSAARPYPDAPTRGPHQQRLAHQQRQPPRGPQQRPQAGTYGAVPSHRDELPRVAPGEIALHCSRCGSAFVAEELERPFETQCPVCGRWELVR